MKLQIQFQTSVKSSFTTVYLLNGMDGTRSERYKEEYKEGVVNKQSQEENGLVPGGAGQLAPRPCFILSQNVG